MKSRLLLAFGMTIGRRRAALWLPLFALLLFLALSPASAKAHANLVESDPAVNSVLPDSPQRVAITFTEPLEPALSEIRVLDAQGRRVDSEDSAVDPDDRRLMTVSVGSLENGTYTVVWKNVSTVDGHRVRGAFVFSVGEPISPSASTADLEQPVFQSPFEPAIRWMVLFDILAVVGGMTFLILVARPALTALAVHIESAADLRDVMTWGLMRMALLMSAALLVASTFHLMVQASIVYEISVSEAMGSPMFSLVTQTDWGRLWIWRALLILFMIAVLAVESRKRRNEDEPSGGAAPIYLVTALGLGVLLTISMTSHAAATPNVRGMALLNDLAHLVAASVWAGGLLSLFATLYVSGALDKLERRLVIAALARQFAIVAGISVAVLVLTGLYSAWAQVTVARALSTPYGWTLTVKIAVVALLLLVAAANLIWVRPRIISGGRAAQWLRRLVAVECVLAALVILSVGFLTAFEPARQVASRSDAGDQRLTFQESNEGADMTLQIVPAHVGPNNIEVSLRDRFGEPITNATDVRVRLSYLDEDLGESPLSATHAGGGEYVLSEQLIGLAGAWQAEIVVQRPDSFDARAAFRFEVSGGGGSLAIAPSEETGRTLLGIELGVLGLVLLGVGVPMGGWFSRAGRLTMASGMLGVIAGAALAFNSLGGNAGMMERNPIPPSSESVNMGLALYQTHCLLCHGYDGVGDVPSAAAMNPPPADLTVHVPLHPDRALFDFVHDGIPGTAMPALGAALSDEEIWHIINYTRTLE